MELKEHSKIYKKSKAFIIIFALVVAVIGYLFASYKAETYTVAVSFDVNLVNRADTENYEYGSYYDLKGAEMFTQHLMSLLMTPSVITQIYDAAGLSYEIDNLPSFTNRFKSKQFSAQNFYVTFTDYGAEQGEKLGIAVGQVIEQKAKTANADTKGKSQFSVEAADPVVVKNELNPWFAGLGGLIAGFVLSILIVYLREYFKE